MTEQKKKLKQELIDKIYSCNKSLCRRSGNVQTDLVYTKEALFDLLSALSNYLEEDLYYDD